MNFVKKSGLFFTLLFFVTLFMEGPQIFHWQLGIHEARAAVLKSVQSGTTTMSGASITATITAVDTTKAFLVFSVNENLGNGYDGQVTGQLTNATTITFTRMGNSGTVLPVMKWYVAEFTSGVSVQRGAANMAGLTTLAVGLTGATLANSFPIVSLRNSGGTTYDGNDFVKADITSTTNLQLDLQTAGDGNCNVEWQVVTFTDANVTNGDIAFAAGDATKTATVSIPDLTKAWLIYTYNSANGTGTNIGQKLVRGLITNGTTLTFDRNNTGQAINLTWYLVQFTDATTVQRGSATFNPATVTQANVTITAVTTANSMAVGGYTMRGGISPNATQGEPGVSWFTLDLTTTTNLQITRAQTTSTADVGWFVIQFSTTSAPPAPVATAATNILVANFSANWNASTGATGYYLDVSTDTNFGSFVTGYNNLDVGNVLTYSVNANITPDTTYYYRVRAYSTGGTSGNSNTITLTTTACSSPATIALVGSAVGTTATTATVSPTATMPSGVQSGNLLLAWVVTNHNYGINGVTGWNQIGSTLNNNGDSDVALFYRVADGTEGSTWTFSNLIGTADRNLIVISAWSGVDTSNPINTSASLAGSALATAISGPSITPSQDHCMIIQLLGADPDAAGYTATKDTSPVGTEIYDVEDTNSYAYAAIQYYLQSTAAALALDFTALTSDYYGRFQVALNPACNGSFLYRRSITIADSMTPASCGSNLSNFPILVSISNDANLKDVTHSGHVQSTSGWDIIFRALNDTTCNVAGGGTNPCTLDHEIEAYDGSAGTLIAWVRIPTLTYNANSTIYMYYGNSTISSPTENPTGVWDSNYKAVWHLKESGNGTAGEFKDSTSVNNGQGGGGTAAYVPTLSTTGEIDGAQSFDGTNDYISVANNASLNVTSQLTMEAWVNLTNASNDQKIVGKTNNVVCSLGYILGVQGGLHPEIWNSSGTHYSFNVGTISNTTWTHLAVTWTTGGNMVGYINGVTPTGGSISAGSTNIGTYTNPLYMGTAPYNHTQYFVDGTIDEVRISNTARTQCWIQTEYNNQSAPSTFLTVGTETSSPPTAVLLSSFTATEYEGKVLLQWRTGYESNNLGFNAYREEEDGQLTQINSELISGGAFLAGAKRATAGHTYAWVDSELSAVSYQPSAISTPTPALPPRGGGVGWGAFRYWLEDVDLSGKRTMNGPVTPDFSLEPLPEKAQAALMSQLSRGQSEKDRVASRLWALQTRLGRTPSSSQITPSSTLPPRGGGTGWGGPSPQSAVGGLRSSVRPPSGELVVSGVDTGSKKGALPSGPLNLSDRPGQIVSLPSGQQKKLTPQEVQWVLAGSPGLKLFIQEEGWYRVTQPELVAAGLDPRVNPRLLQLYVDGVEQAITVRVQKDGQFGSQDSIEFYATGLDTLSTETRVYWLVAGAKPGQRVALVGILTGQAGSASFPFSVEKKPRTLYFAALKNGDASNFFGPMVWTTPVDQVLSLSHLDPAPPGEATLEVSLQGATAGTHLVQVQLNGVQVGSLVFADQSLGVATLSVSQSLLLEGDNRVTLLAQGGEMDVSMIDSIRLTYWHTYTADNDTLRFTASGGQQLLIDGFSSSRVRVVDITDPKGVQEVVGQVNLQGSGYAVRFGVPGSGLRTLLVFTGDQMKSAAAIEANQTSRWYQAGWSADLVIISPASFLESVSPLKALRESQGWSVALVDVEDLYDEFSFGNKTPQALRDFLLRAKIYWQKSPRFVLLVGDASVDPRNYLGLGNFDLVPTKLIDTDVLETASDDWFVDFNGDGLPQMAVGRMPVRTVEEAQIVVLKIVGYERSAQSLRDVLLVADMKGGEEDYDFEGASLEVQGLLPGGLTVYQIFRGQFADDVQVHGQLLGRINEGKLLVNYIGHGSEAIWRGDILTSDDAAALTNGLRLPFVVSMTCLNGFFQDVYGGSLAEALLKAPQGGAVAVWASSGLTEPDGQTVMDKELVRLLFNGESLTLGEATARAKSATGDGDVRRTWILFGDPTTRLKY